MTIMPWFTKFITPWTQNSKFTRPSTTTNVRHGSRPHTFRNKARTHTHTHNYAKSAVERAKQPWCDPKRCNRLIIPQTRYILWKLIPYSVPQINISIHLVLTLSYYKCWIWRRRVCMPLYWKWGSFIVGCTRAHWLLTHLHIHSQHSLKQKHICKHTRKNRVDYAH